MPRTSRRESGRGSCQARRRRALERINSTGGTHATGRPVRQPRSARQCAGMVGTDERDARRAGEPDDAGDAGTSAATGIGDGDEHSITNGFDYPGPSTISRGSGRSKGQPGPAGLDIPFRFAPALPASPGYSCQPSPFANWPAWHAEAVTHTAMLMSDARVPAVFEAAFEYENVRIRVDVLERLASGTWGCVR